MRRGWSLRSLGGARRSRRSPATWRRSGSIRARSSRCGSGPWSWPSWPRARAPTAPSTGRTSTRPAFGSRRRGWSPETRSTGCAAQREALVDVLLAAPFDLPTPAPVRDDGRPEAGRRDAFALIEAADAALEVTEEQGQPCRRRARTCGARAGRAGRRSRGRSRASPVSSAGCPEVIELPSSAPPSAAIRLQRAGLRVTVDAPA